VQPPYGGDIAAQQRRIAGHSTYSDQHVRSVAPSVGN
ncbi:hypothetical protein A2U01_0042481, partial [Trifolium medium]|nr:hypothetical protein [Trifolium medium]